MSKEKLDPRFWELVAQIDDQVKAFEKRTNWNEDHSSFLDFVVIGRNLFIILGELNSLIVRDWDKFNKPMKSK